MDLAREENKRVKSNKKNGIVNEREKTIHKIYGI